MTDSPHFPHHAGAGRRGQAPHLGTGLAGARHVGENHVGESFGGENHVGEHLFGANLSGRGPAGDAEPLRPWEARGAVSLTDTDLAQLVERIEAVSAYVRDVEANAASREQRVVEMHGRMRALLAEAEAQVRSADARARDERERAELAEERVRTLESWLLKIMDTLAPLEDTFDS